MALNIPKRHRPILARLLKLTRSDIERLALALREIEKPTLSTDTLAKAIASKSTLDEIAADEVLAMLISLFNIPRNTSVSKDQLMADFLEAIEVDPEFKATKEEVSVFRPFIEEALSSDTLGTIAKGLLLLSGHEHLFCKATIFTDLRPVFPDELNGSPSAVVASHMLRVSYHPRDFSTVDFYVALGSDDLDELATVIDRARRKEDRLRELTEQTGLAFLAAEEQC